MHSKTQKAQTTQATEPDPFFRYLETRSPEDFTRLVEATQEHVRAFAFKTTRDRDLADDVVQEVYLALLTGDHAREGLGPLRPAVRAALDDLTRGYRPSRKRRGAAANGKEVGTSHGA